MRTHTYIIVSVFFLVLAGAVVYLQLTGGNGKSLTTALQPLLKTGAADLKPQGQAPEFAGISQWLNLPADSTTLSLGELAGKVVLVDFWTYSCINCIRTLPYVTRWHETYKDQGLVVVGIHTPEFDFEKNTANLKTAMARYGIEYPVAQDNNYATWRAYNNHYWPAKYLIDQTGQVVYTHFGEGDYDITENAIRRLLGLDRKAESAGDNSRPNVQSPEMYFGLNRLQNLSPEQTATEAIKLYQLPGKVALNRFALAGSWQFAGESAALVAGPGNIRLRFFAAKVFMVAAAEKPIKLRIKVDGVAQPDVTVQASQLYTLFDSEGYRERELEIEISEAGLQAFTFTFG